MSCARVPRSSAASRPRTRTPAFSPRVGSLRSCASPPGRACEWTRRCYSGMTVPTEYDHAAREGDAPTGATGSKRSPACVARWRRCACPACRRPLPFHRSALFHQDFVFRLRRHILSSESVGRARSAGALRWRDVRRRSCRRPRVARAQRAARGGSRRSTVVASGARRRASLMRYEVTLDDRRVRVELTENGWFTVDDHVVAADVRETVRGRPMRRSRSKAKGITRSSPVVTHDPLRLDVDGQRCARDRDRRARAPRGSRRGGNAHRPRRAAGSRCRSAEGSPREGGRSGRGRGSTRHGRGHEDGERVPVAARRHGRPCRDGPSETPPSSAIRWSSSGDAAHVLTGRAREPPTTVGATVRAKTLKGAPDRRDPLESRRVLRSAIRTPRPNGRSGGGARPRLPRGVPVHPGRPAHDVPQPLLDHAAVRGFRDSPKRPMRRYHYLLKSGSDRAVGGVRPADADGQ